MANEGEEMSEDEVRPSLRRVWLRASRPRGRPSARPGSRIHPETPHLRKGRAFPLFGLDMLCRLA